MRPIKRVAAIHDLVGLGRTSLTVVIPIISTMGMQVCPLPTAVLSNHTKFNNYSFLDLTDNMQNHIKEWEKQNLEFDSIYSGFLGSTRQIDIVSNFIDQFNSKDCLVVVDPVMGDNGRLYSTMDDTMVKNMKRLIKKADIITPNFTEAAYLLSEPYNKNISEDKLKDWLKRLADNGINKVIITSVPTKDPEQTSVVAYDREEDKYYKITCEYVPVDFPGTGDIFTSVLVGSLLQKNDLSIALNKSVKFITDCIKESYHVDYDKKEGVLLEKALKKLSNK